MVLSMFNEKNEENGLPVYQTGKYIESKNKAIELINSGKYGLSESDFWIMMRTNKQKTSMIYTGLIISHTGCLKINDASENKVDPKAFVTFTRTNAVFGEGFKPHKIDAVTQFKNKKDKKDGK